MKEALENALEKERLAVDEAIRKEREDNDTGAVAKNNTKTEAEINCQLLLANATKSNN